MNAETTSANERRRFSRILFDAQIELAQGDYHWHASLLDISLRGLLIEQPLPDIVDKSQPILVKILLGEAATIAMSTLLAHEHHQQTGLVCRAIDSDSICHLRRLIELNLGDAHAAERELHELIRAY